MSHKLVIGPIAMSEAAAVLKEVENVFVSCVTDGVSHELRFTYKLWHEYRRNCFRALARHTRRPRVPKKLRKQRRQELYKITGAFAGSRTAYERRTRKFCFAQMMEALRATVPDVDRERGEILAGTVPGRGTAGYRKSQAAPGLRRRGTLPRCRNFFRIAGMSFLSIKSTAGPTLTATFCGISKP